MNTVLFLCTGNYYRSRFAEFYFRHLAREHVLPWSSDSRGLALDPWNTGHMSSFTENECRRLGISVEPLRFPITLETSDLERAHLVIAVKETEHRPMLKRSFAEWENRIEYWEIHDIDFEPPHVALPQLKSEVENLVERLRKERP